MRRRRTAQPRSACSLRTAGAGIGIASHWAITLSLRRVPRGRTHAGSPVHPEEGGPDMMPQSVEPEIRRVVAERLGVGQEELTPEVSLFDDLAVDSLDMVELELALEDEFGIPPVPEHVLGAVRTYQQVVDRVLDLGRATAADGSEPPFGLAPLWRTPGLSRVAAIPVSTLVVDRAHHVDG